MRVALDIDEVLAKYYEEFIEWHNQRFSEQLPPYNDWHTTKLEAYLEFDGDGSRYDRINAYMDERLTTIEPYQESQDVLESWSADASFIAVTRRPDKYHDETWLWLTKHYGDAFDLLECTTHVSETPVRRRCKGALCYAYDVDIFIDDVPGHVRRAEDHDVKGVVMTRPWNKTVSVPRRASSWDDVDRELRRVAERL